MAHTFESCQSPRFNKFSYLKEKVFFFFWEVKELKYSFRTMVKAEVFFYNEPIDYKNIYQLSTTRNLKLRKTRSSFTIIATIFI